MRNVARLITSISGHVFVISLCVRARVCVLCITYVCAMCVNVFCGCVADCVFCVCIVFMCCVYM